MAGIALSCIGMWVAGCGGGGASPTAASITATAPASGTTPVASAVRRGTPIDQDLTFTGPVAGHMASAVPQCVLFKSTGVFQSILTGNVGSAEHMLRIVLQNFTGPGPYESTSDVLRAATVLDTGGGAPSKAAVNADGKSGTLDTDTAEGGHISGSWACTAVVNAP